MREAAAEAEKAKKASDSKGVWWSLRTILQRRRRASRLWRVLAPLRQGHQQGLRAVGATTPPRPCSVTGDADERTTVAVLLSLSRHPSRPWDTTVVAVSGDMGFTDEDLAALRELWPTPVAA
jgi:hypothetical protein